MAEPDRGPTTGTPRWVKIVGIIAVVLLLVLGIIMLVGGEHGPGRHIPPAAGSTP
jgi:L-asparagine transporter-like permease